MVLLKVVEKMSPQNWQVEFSYHPIEVHVDDPQIASNHSTMHLQITPLNQAPYMYVLNLSLWKSITEPVCLTLYHENLHSAFELLNA